MCLLAHSERASCDLAATGTIDWVDPRPSSRDEMIETFENNYRELTNHLRTLDDDGWEQTGRFVEEGHLVMEGPRRDIFWLIFLDAIHHRGQLSTYIRPMGGKVPSIYGPSADAGPG